MEKIEYEITINLKPKTTDDFDDILTEIGLLFIQKSNKLKEYDIEFRKVPNYGTFYVKLHEE